MGPPLSHPASCPRSQDVCSYGETQYPGESEGLVHCHGFVWPEDATDEYILLQAYYVEEHDHQNRRQYHGK